MDHQTFDSKWQEISAHKKCEESCLFVPPGRKPITQRQLNLFTYHEFVSQMIKGKGYKDAIEIGCGRGTLAMYLKVYEGLNVICNDNEESAIAVARKNFADFKLNSEFIVADAAKLPLQSESVDVCVSIGLLEHIPDYKPILAEQYRILRKGGMIVSLNIPKKNSVQNLNNVYRSIYKWFNPSYPLKTDYFRNADKPEDYKRKAEAVGFTDVKLTNVNPFPIFTPLPWVIEKTVAYVYRGILALRRSFMKYPFKTNYPMSQAHFMVGIKK